MIQLIKAEFKKLCKSKINIILFICLMLYSGFQCFTTYNNEEFNALQQTQLLKDGLMDKNGKSVSTLDYWRLADEMQHKYAGTLTTSTASKMKADFMNIMKEYPRDKHGIDQNAMENLYGKNYEAKFKKAVNGEYTVEEFHEKFEAYIIKNSGFFFDEVPNSNKIIVYLDTIYKNDSIRYLYYYLYGIFPAKDAYEKKNANHGFSNFQLGESMNEWLNAPTMDKAKVKAIVSGVKNPSKSIEALINEFSNRFTSSDYKIDSNIGNTLYVNSLSSLGFISLIIIIIILSNSFAMDHHYKTDQYMCATPKGYRKTVIAKLCTGTLLTIGITVLQLLLVTIMASIFVGLRDLDLTYYAQSGASITNVNGYLFSFRELIWSGTLLISVGALVTAFITMLLSYLTKNRFAVVIPLLIVILLTSVVPWFSRFNTGIPLDQFMPGQMLNFTQFFSLPYDYQTGGLISYFYIGDTIVAWKDIIMIFWMFTIVAISGFIYYRSKRHYVKNS